MSESPAAEDERAWRRRFASRANNRAWTLAEQPSRNPEEDLEMLDAAHAAMHLWSVIGPARNIALAQLLLGHVHALLGDPRFAMSYAQAAHAYLSANASEPWEAAIPHAVLAGAAYCAGNAALYETNYRAAVALIAQIPNAQEKAVAEATMKVIPKGNL